MHFVAWWQRNRLLFSFYSFKKTAVFCALHLIKHSSPFTYNLFFSEFPAPVPLYLEREALKL